MLSDSALKNLLPELQFLIFNGLSVAILGRLRCVCKKFSLCTHLKKFLDTHNDHARIRFEKVVYTAKPFFPEKIRNRTMSDEIKKSNIYSEYRFIIIAKKCIGELEFTCGENKEVIYWDCECYLPKLWSNFFRNHDRIHCKMILQKHFKKTINPFIITFNGHEILCWHQRQNTESKYVNYAEAETQFWSIFGIVSQWTPENFFASTQMFF